MDAYRVSLQVAFSPPLSIARQQQVMEALDALDTEQLDVDQAGCALTVVAQGADSEAARNEAEFTVARVLATAGHTMHTAPIRTTSVVRTG